MSERPNKRRRVEAVRDQGLPGYRMTETTDPLVARFGIEMLEKRGYIDMIDGPPDDDAEFNRYPVHPMFDKRNFAIYDSLSDISTPLEVSEYTSISPSLRLASRILNDPSVQPFFAGVVAHDKYKPLKRFPPSFAPVNERYYTFEDIPSDPRDPVATWRTVAQLSKSILFRFTDMTGTGFLMSTTLDIDGPKHGRWGLRDHTTFPVLCSIQPDLLTAVHDPDQSRANKLDRVATYEKKARLLRSHLSFAISIVHEICHALNWFSKEWLPDTSARLASAVPNPIEPFYKDQRIAETGFAFEGVLLSGILEATGVLDDRLTEVSMQPLSSAPYGMHIIRWPGRNINAPSLGTAAEYGRKWSSIYPVTMKWMRDFFTESFWDKKVGSEGLKAFHPIRWHGIRLPEPDLEPGKTMVSTREPETPEPVEFDIDFPPPLTEVEAQEFREHYKTAEADAEELREFHRTRAGKSPGEGDDREMDGLRD